MMSTLKMQILIHVVYLYVSNFADSTISPSKYGNRSIRIVVVVAFAVEMLVYQRLPPPTHAQNALQHALTCACTQSHHHQTTACDPAVAMSHTPSHRASKQICWVPRCDRRSLNVDDSWSPSRPAVGQYERERNPILLQTLLPSPVRYNGRCRDQGWCHRWVHLTLNWGMNILIRASAASPKSCLK